MAYMQGEFPGYPEEILKRNLTQVYERLQFMRSDTEDPARYGDAYLQLRNPITCEGLMQLTLGAPLPVYNGGLMMAPLRHFDPQAKRPGLPPEVAALVSKVSEDNVVVTLVNLAVDRTREVLIQAGALAEHEFTTVAYHSMVNRKPQPATIALGGGHLTVVLPPGGEAALSLGLKRFTRRPTYRLPWDRAEK